DFGGALDKDVVVLQIKHKLTPIRGMNREAKVLSVKSRNMKFVVGELEKKKNVFYIRLDRQDVDNVKIINPDDYQVGDIVKAEIVSYKPLEASIVERIGIKNDIGVDILTIA